MLCTLSSLELLNCLAWENSNLIGCYYIRAIISFSFRVCVCVCVCVCVRLLFVCLLVGWLFSCVATSLKNVFRYIFFSGIHTARRSSLECTKPDPRSVTRYFACILPFKIYREWLETFLGPMSNLRTNYRNVSNTFYDFFFFSFSFFFSRQMLTIKIVSQEVWIKSPRCCIKLFRTVCATSPRFLQCTCVCVCVCECV